MTLFITIFTQLIVMISFLIIPFISKKDVLFGVKIPTSSIDDPEIKQVRKRFLVMTFSAGVLIILAQFVSALNSLHTSAIFIALIFYFAIYLISYRSMRKIKSNRQWKAANTTVIDTNFRQNQLVLSPLWYIGYFLIFFVTVILVIANYDSLPEMLGTQTNSNGEAVNFWPKDKAIFYLLGTQAFVMLLMVFVQVVIKRAKQDLSSMNPAASVRNSVRFRFIFSVILYVLGLMIGMILMLSMMFTMGIIQDSALLSTLIMIIVFIPVVILLVLVVRFGQDGSNRMLETSDVIDKDDDKFWVLGIFYFNKNDPSVFISKRVGVGWSFNNAKWQTWVMYLVLIAFIMGSLILES